MKTISFDKLEKIMSDLLLALGMDESNVKIMVKMYSDITKRGVGHHDIYEFPSRIGLLRRGRIKVNPNFKKISSFGCMESWDGDNGLGELINTFSMNRAVSLAQIHGVGFCTMKNSNHYLASAPYVTQAAENGCIGIIIAKGLPTMGVPGVAGNVVSQSPMGFAFPTSKEWPVMLDICLAYASFGKLKQLAEDKQPVPEWWGVDADGNPTTDAAKLLKGTKYPIGEHKGYGLALLCELLTGVLSRGFILDEGEDQDIAWTSTSHTAIAIKVDALMTMDEYLSRSSMLIDRIKTRSPGIRIPGQRSYEKIAVFDTKGSIDLSDELVEELNKCAKDLDQDGI